MGRVGSAPRVQNRYKLGCTPRFRHLRQMLVPPLSRAEHPEKYHWRSAYGTYMGARGRGADVRTSRSRSLLLPPWRRTPGAP